MIGLLVLALGYFLIFSSSNLTKDNYNKELISTEQARAISGESTIDNSYIQPIDFSSKMALVCKNSFDCYLEQDKIMNEWLKNNPDKNIFDYEIQYGSTSGGLMCEDKK